MTQQTTDEIDVTVIVPIYHNAAQNLSRCLDSIVGQTLKTVEILLLCDDNLHDSIEICDKYASNDQRISVIRLSGLNIGEACNQGISKSRGKYLSFVEPDDWIEPEMHQTLIERASRFDADVIQAFYYDVNPDLEKNINSDLAWGPIFLEEKLTNKFLIPNLYLKWAYCWGRIYKKEFINLNNIRFSDKNNPKNIGYDLSFSYLVFCYLTSSYIVRASLYNHSIPNKESLTSNPYSYAMSLLNTHSYIFDLTKERSIGEDIFQLEFARYVSDIKQCYNYLQNLKQRSDYLNTISPILKGYKLLIEKNNYINQDDKRLLQKYTTHPGRTAFLDKRNTHIKIFKFLINIQLKSKVTHVKIFNFPLLFIKNVPDYKTFNICRIPITRVKITRNNDNSLITCRTYFLGVRFYKKITTPNTITSYILIFRVWKKLNFEAMIINLSKRIEQLPKENDILYYASMSSEIAKTHGKTFPSFKNSNNGNSVAIFGAGPTLNFAPVISKSKILVCNRAYEYFANRNFDYFFGQDYQGIKSYYYKAIEKSKYAFIGRYAKKTHWYSTPEQLRDIENVYSYYFMAEFYSSILIKSQIESFPLADFYTVVHPALHFTLYTNPKTIYLIGCDTSRGGYANKNILQFDTNIPNMIIGYKKLKELKEREYPNTRIISVNPVGLKGIFEDVYTKKFLENEPEVNKTNLTIIDEI